MLLPKTLLSGDALYDYLMRQIEPELTTTNKETLPQLYANETSDESKARAERYNKAFEAYAAALETYRLQWTKDLRQYHRVAMTSLEQRNRENTKPSLSDLETAFDSSLPTQP